MDVVGHKAERMNAMAIASYPFLHKKVETVTVAVLKKDVLSGITTQNDVVKGARAVDSWFSSHDPMNIRHESNNTSLTPQHKSGVGLATQRSTFACTIN